MWLKVWNKIANDENIEKDLMTKMFYQRSEETVERNNVILNVLLAGVFIILLNIKLWQLPLILIAFDFLFAIINTTNFNHIDKKYNNILKGYKSEKYLMMLKNKRDYYEKHCVNCNSCSKYRECSNGISFEQKIKDLNYIIKTIEKNVDEIVNTDVVKASNENKQSEYLRIYKKIVEDLKNEDFNELPKKYQKDIIKSIIISEKLLNEVEKNPSAYKLVQNTFEIYLVELINAITDVDKLDNGLKEIYHEKINNLVVEYNNHVETLIERVSKYNLTTLDVNINTLLKEMKNEK